MESSSAPFLILCKACACITSNPDRLRSTFIPQQSRLYHWLRKARLRQYKPSRAMFSKNGCNRLWQSSHHPQRNQGHPVRQSPIISASSADGFIAHRRSVWARSFSPTARTLFLRDKSCAPSRASTPAISHKRKWPETSSGHHHESAGRFISALPSTLSVLAPARHAAQCSH